MYEHRIKLNQIQTEKFDSGLGSEDLETEIELSNLGWVWV